MKGAKKSTVIKDRPKYDEIINPVTGASKVKK
jgi:hypothetical protein